MSKWQAVPFLGYVVIFQTMWITALLWEALQKRKPQHEVGDSQQGAMDIIVRWRRRVLGEKGLSTELLASHCLGILRTTARRSLF